MGRSSRCADCDAPVVVTRAKTRFRGGAMVLLCHMCAGDPEPPEYDEMVVEGVEDVDDMYDDVEISVGEPEGDANVVYGGDSDSVSGDLDVAEHSPRQRDPTLPPVVVDKAT